MTTKGIFYKLILFIPLVGIIGSIGCNTATISEEPKDPVYLWSHNDYEQEKPLERALELGFNMIESDIHLINGELYVIHDHPENLDGIPLLEDLYLKPLVDRIEKNNGEILPGSSKPFYLVIDVKTEAQSTYRALLSQLDPYEEYFYRKAGGEWIHGPIHLLISGNRPELDSSSDDRIAFLDGRLPDLGTGVSTELYPLISDNWNHYFSWTGEGELPEDQRKKLKDYVSRVHSEGKILRFWATRDNELVWQTLIDHGVDVINVDDLEGMREFLDDYNEQ